MTAILVWSRRKGALLWAALALLAVGCSPESPAPAPSPASGVAPTAADARPAAPSAWSAETLADGEFTLEEGFRKLSLEDFNPFFAKPPQAGQATWFSIHDAIVCTGKPRGYLYSNEKFADFTLRLELRFAPPADAAAAKTFNPNTGVMIYITEPHKQWPKSLEVQGKFAELATIKENGGAAKFEIVDDGAARESARKPVGEWNALEIVSKAGALTALLNGTKVCESQPSDVSEGFIGLQSEDFEVHFRRLRIRAE
ncbi:MAG: DUF1080 domain-containing protein [Planctomycetaceae bacterium]|nr:DUF1080 domain-containing protein [Planctomycetaceae bacterium]